MELYLTWFILLFPFAGFLIAGTAGRKLPGTTAGWIASLMILLSFVSVIWLFVLYGDRTTAWESGLFTWISNENFTIDFSLYIDRLSLLMLMIVTGVSFLIHIYSIGYMKGDEGFSRFFSWMNLFVFFMTLLVAGGNYLLLFIGWEGVGLCSYLLIGFWYKNRSYNFAASKAFIMNRIGDLGFIFAMLLMLTHFGTLSFVGVENAVSANGDNGYVILAITLLLFAGATGKSAQIPLFNWLPDAMAGPTPVSALIHAATMVTAGVYLLARSGFMFVLAPLTMDIVLGIGIATAMLAAIIALFQNDIKKVLAYSTVSQLGFMFVSIGAGSFTGAMFHLTTHAFFKALLFLCAGSVIHALSGEQDIRKMGGLRRKLPVTFYTFLAGSLAISGIPPLAGFFSKDAILASVFGVNITVWTLAALVSFMTAAYMFRLFFLVFAGKSRTPDAHPHESPAVMLIPLAVLGFLSVFAGFAGMPAVFGVPNFFGDYLSPVLSSFESAHHLSHLAEYILMAVSVMLALTALFITYRHIVRKSYLPPDDGVLLPAWKQLAYGKFYIDEIYESLFACPLKKLSAFFYNRIEAGGIDRFVNFTGRAVKETAGLLRHLQSGFAEFYILIMVVGIVALLLFNIF